MKLKSKNAINLIVVFLEIVLILGICLIEYMSTYKAGLMHHLYYKKMEYISRFYTSEQIVYHIAIVLIIIIVMIIFNQSRKTKSKKQYPIRLIFFFILMIISFYTPVIQGINTYGYWLILLESIIVVEIIINIVLNKKTMSF